MKTTRAIALAAVNAAFGASLVVGFSTLAHADTWSCVDDGNRVCAPGNSNGAPAGCYDDGGVLEFNWPCTPWTPDMGYKHPDGTITYPNGDVGLEDGTIIKSGDHSHDIPAARGFGVSGAALAPVDHTVTLRSPSAASAVVSTADCCAFRCGRCLVTTVRIRLAVRQVVPTISRARRADRCNELLRVCRARYGCVCAAGGS